MFVYQGRPWFCCQSLLAEEAFDGDKSGHVLSSSVKEVYRVRRETETETERRIRYNVHFPLTVTLSLLHTITANAMFMVSLVLVECHSQ